MFSYLILGLGGLLFGAVVYRYDMHEREPWWMLVLAVLAGTLEELGKLAVPAAVLLFMKKHFNDPMDGLIYGSLAGLGAAVFEGAWWQWFAPADGTSVISVHGPNAMRLLMHTLWGGIVGSALGLIVMKKPWRQTLAKRVGLVMLIHFGWDLLIGFVPADQQNNWHRLVAALLIGASVIWYGLLVVQANKWSRSMHNPTGKQRLVGKIVRMIITRRFR